ncbi:MAG: polyphosphate polymerase domain-containing protein [Erysipelotrichaceae bacterium]|nr:polyphosphate polymerase domain-containing protein [Erysipelotrichaceae bacterium]
MNATKMIFQRLEKKYLLTHEQRSCFLAQAQSHLISDPFGPATICNIYFDNAQDHMIATSLQKPPYKEKLRMRSYGIAHEDMPIYLELKKKCRGIVNKRRIALSLAEANTFLKTGELISAHTQIAKEIEYVMHFYRPYPKVFLAYDRVPLIGKDEKDLRITLDTGIRRRYDNLCLDAHDQGALLMDESMTLMEIKVSAAYPLWLSHLLAQLSLYPISFSKYGRIYTADCLTRAQSEVRNMRYDETINIRTERNGVHSCLTAYSMK